MVHGAWILVPGTQEHGAWFMDHGAALLLRCLVHGSWCLDPGTQIILELLQRSPGAWIMDHGAIPWVLVALDPGAQDHEPQHVVLDQLTPTTTYCVLVYSQE